MTRDPILAEIHRIREQIWKECHGDVGELAMRQRRLQEEVKDRLIDPVKWKRRKRKARR